MATVNVGGQTVNIDDTLFNKYQTQVASGTLDANMAAKSLLNDFGNNISSGLDLNSLKSQGAVFLDEQAAINYARAYPNNPAAQAVVAQLASKGKTLDSVNIDPAAQTQLGYALTDPNSIAAALKGTPNVVYQTGSLANGQTPVAAAGTIPVQNTPTTQQTQPAQIQSPQPTTTQQVSQQPTPQPQSGVLPPNVSLQPGQSGTQVKQLQDWLVSQGYLTQGQVATGPGIYGPQTTAALAKWQQDHGVDTAGNPGYFGPRTMAAINTQKSSISTPNAVNTQGALTQASELAKTISTSLQSLSDKGYANVDINNLPAGVNISDLPQVQKVTNSLAQNGVTAQPEVLHQVAQQDPIEFVSQVYSSLYKNSGLADIKSQYETFVQKKEDLTNKQNVEILEINNNPWLDEGTRLKRIAKTKEKYAGQIDSATNSAQLLQGFYDKGNQQMQFLTGQAISVYNNQADFQNQLYRDAINNAAQREDTLLKLQNDNANKAADRELNVQELIAKYSQPISIGENSSLYDPNTGQIIFKGAGVGTGGSGGLTSAQINATVNQIAGAFDNEQLVKNYNTINTAVKTFNSLGNSATDDIQRVYTFAKIADPTSAVKEGEYNSIEKYSQALLQRVGLNVGRVFTAKGILTPEARSAMSKTIQSSLDSAKSSYDQVANEYQRQINDAYAGKPRQITNYQTPTTQVTTSQFDYLAPYVTKSGTKAYIPRVQWSLVQDKDGLLQTFKNLGYELLIN